MKKLTALFLVLVFTLALAATAFAHPGRTDSNGGHWDRRTGTYHKQNFLINVSWQEIETHVMMKQRHSVKPMKCMKQSKHSKSKLLVETTHKRVLEV